MTTAMEQEGRTSSAFELEELVERCMGNLEFVERVLTKFQQRFGEQLEELEQAVAQRDAERLVLVAHRLKGESASVAAAALRDRAGEIERLGRAGQVSNVPPCLQRLRAEWAEFAESVSTLDW